MDCAMIAFLDKTLSNFVYVNKVQNYISSKRHIPEDIVLLFVMPSIVFWKRKLEYVISNSSQCANNLLLK